MKNLFACIVAAALLGPTAAQAQFVNLVDGSAAVRILRNGPEAGTVDRWSIGGGISQLTQQSYHYRVAGDGFEQYVGTLGAAAVSQPGSNFAEFSWTGGRFDLRIRYLLTGGNGNADLAEVVRIENTSTQAMTIHLFEYDDFDLNGALGDTATRSNSSTIVQSDGAFGVTVGAAPIPSATQVAGFPDILANLLDGDVDDLDPTLGSFGPGDATFGMQWTVALAPGETFLMSKNKILAVPEPGSLAALGLGGALLARRRRPR